VEFLALRDGMLQQVRTAGDALEVCGEPFRQRADTSRSGVPQRVVTADRIPSECLCSWSYVCGKLTLKYSNTACPLFEQHRK
jgi:hypothetical protein